MRREATSHLCVNPGPTRLQPVVDRDMTIERSPLEDAAGAAEVDWTTVAALTLAYALVRMVVLLGDRLAASLRFGGSILGPLESWDAQHYLAIALHGYPATIPEVAGHLGYSVAAFTPGYPLLTAALHLLGPSVPSSAYLVSVFAGWAAVLGIWRLASGLVSASRATDAALLFLVFPGVVLGWGLLYSEPVGLAFVAWSLVALRDRWYLVAGILAAMATLSSPAALALAVAGFAQAVFDLRRGRGARALAVPAGALIGIGSYLGYLAVRYDDLTYYWRLQRQAWGTHLDGGIGLLRALVHPGALGPFGPGLLLWMGLAVAVGFALATWRAHLPVALWSYVVANLALLWCTDGLGPKPRMLSWCLPAFVAVAAVLSDRARRVLLVGCAVAAPVLVLTYTTMGNSIGPP